MGFELISLQEDVYQILKLYQEMLKDDTGKHVSFSRIIATSLDKSGITKKVHGKRLNLVSR